MKFAVLALLGAVSAAPIQEEELDEMIKVLYPKKALKKYERQAMNIYGTYMENKDMFDAERDEIMDPLMHWADARGPAYLR